MSDGQRVLQRETDQLFDVSTDNIGLHLKKMFEDGELNREATTEDSSVIQIEGGREVQRALALYNLDAILAVGYRLRSPRGVQFRRWASTALKDYLLKGCSESHGKQAEAQTEKVGFFPDRPKTRSILSS